MPLLRSINEYGIHLPLEVVISKGNGKMSVLDPSDEVKGEILARDEKVTITTTLAPEFQPD